MVPSPVRIWSGVFQSEITRGGGRVVEEGERESADALENDISTATATTRRCSTSNCQKVIYTSALYLAITSSSRANLLELNLLSLVFLVDISVLSL